MPFAGYKDFAACVRANKDKKNPEAYCGTIMHQVEGKEREYDIKIDKKIPVYGSTNCDKRLIKINPKKGDVVNTIIHEKLHANYPDMPHEEVYKNADLIESKMTLPEMAQELLDVHERALHPTYKPDIKYTVASKVVSNKIN